MVGLIQRLLEREAARFIVWSSAGATALLLAGANALGVDLSAEFVAGFTGFIALVANEAVRLCVFSLNTVEKLVEEAEE